MSGCRALRLWMNRHRIGTTRCQALAQSRMNPRSEVFGTDGFCETERPMRRELPGGYELDDDLARIDVDAVHRYLAEESTGRTAVPAPSSKTSSVGRHASSASTTDDAAGRLRTHLLGRAHAVLSRRRLRPAGAPRQRARRRARSRGRGAQPVRAARAGCSTRRDAHEPVPKFGFGPALRAADGEAEWLTAVRASSRSRSRRGSPSRSPTRRSSCSRSPTSTESSTRRSSASRG